MELVLNTFGSSVHRDNEAFIIITIDGKQRIPAEGITSIQICRGAMISSDAVLLAIENEIDIVFTAKTGAPIGRVWSSKYGSISTIRKGQLLFNYSQKSVDWIKEVLVTKVENQEAILLMLANIKNLDITSTTRRMARYKERIQIIQADTVREIASLLRGLEGHVAKLYFEAYSQMLPSEFQFTERSQHPALDVPNMLLNYGYGLLYNKIESALIKVGIDPYMGVLHRDNYNRPVLVYDVIEVFRYWVDYIVYWLLSQHALTKECYTQREDGSYWLEPLGRQIMIQTFNDYMADLVTINGLHRSRETHIFLYAQAMAQNFKKLQEP